jgi:hypothetical protein
MYTHPGMELALNPIQFKFVNESIATWKIYGIGTMDAVLESSRKMLTTNVEIGKLWTFCPA